MEFRIGFTFLTLSLPGGIHKKSLIFFAPGASRAGGFPLDSDPQVHFAGSFQEPNPT